MFAFANAMIGPNSKSRRLRVENVGFATKNVTVDSDAITQVDGSGLRQASWIERKQKWHDGESRDEDQQLERHADSHEVTETIVPRSRHQSVDR